MAGFWLVFLRSLGYTWGMPDTHTPQTLDLHTSRFRAVHDDLKSHYGVATLGYQPVRTSLGTPRFIGGASEWAYAHLLAPAGLLKIPEWDDFAAAYRERLDRIGVPDICAQLGMILELDEHRRPLLLLCYEDLNAGQRCHRRLFAGWWLEQTGITIPETAPSTFPTRTLDKGKGVLPPSKL
jgi:hypothetical protein